MIGMVLITHGRLAEEFIAALKHVVGEQVQAVCIGPDDDMEQRRLDDILNSVAEVDDDSDVVGLTDIKHAKNLVYNAYNWLPREMQEAEDSESSIDFSGLVQARAVRIHNCGAVRLPYLCRVRHKEGSLTAPYNYLIIEDLLQEAESSNLMDFDEACKRLGIEE
jgi:hypothetical protein